MNNNIEIINNELDDNNNVEIFNKIKDEIYKENNSDLNKIRQLINGADNFNIDMNPENNHYPLLHHTIMKDKYEIAEYFINELNANVDLRGLYGLPSILLVKSSEMLRLLIDNGANVYDVNNNDGNVFIYAVWHNYIAVIETLIYEYDYRIDLKDKQGRTAFDAGYFNFCKIGYDNLVSICKKNVLNRMYVLQDFIDIGCDNNDNISPSIQGITYNEAHERALENLNDDEKDNEELLRRQIAIERIPSLFNTQKSSMFDYRLVGMIFEYINTKPLIPEWDDVNK